MANEADSLRELVKALDDYIDLLGEEFKVLVPFAGIHGMTCPQERVDAGAAARERIARARDAVASKRD